MIAKHDQPRIRFDFGELSSTVPRPTEPADVYLQIGGRFTITVAGELIDVEDNFPVVEFAIKSRVWTRGTARAEQDFLFERVNAGNDGQVWIRRQQDGWNAGSSHQRLSCEIAFSLSEVVTALDDFYTRLRAAVQARYQTDIQSLFAWLAQR